MRSWGLGAGLLVIVACGAVLKPPEPNRRLDLHTSATLFDSDAGYRFLAIPDPQARIARMDVRYPVGAVDDPPGKEGLAHLVEHLLFDVEITRNDAKTSINAEVGRLALSWNAETHTDYTTFETLASSESIEELLQLETERLARGCSAITPEIFAREREVVVNELRERQGASGAAIYRMLLEAVYPAGHPYRASDSVDTVAKLDFKDVCDFLAGPYRRGVVSIVVSGDVDARLFREEAERQFAHVRKRATATRTPPPIVAAKHEAVHLKADVEEPQIIITWPLPPSSTREARLLRMVWEMMPLQVEWFAETYEWGRSARATVIGGEAAPVLALSVIVKSPDKLDDVKKAADSALAFGIRALGPEKDSDQWRIMWQAHAEALLAAWEDLGERNELATEMLETSSTDFLVGRFQELVRASPTDARDLAKQWLDLSKARYLVIEPSGKPNAVQSQLYAGGAPEHPTRVDGALADKPLPIPPATNLSTIRYKLGNGLSVMLWPHGSAPLVHGRLVVNAGVAHDPPGSEGLTSVVGANEIHADHIIFDDREIATRVDELVGALAVELRWPGRSIGDHFKDNVRARLRLQHGKERREYELALAEAVYGKGHPYARPGIGEKSLDELHTDLVKSWARSHIVPSNSTLVIAGQFDAELVKKHVAYNLDQVSSGDPTKPIDATPSPGSDRVSEVETKPSPTIELDIAFLGGRGIDQNHAKRLILETVLDARMSQLRGKQALTYGFSASFTPRRAGGMWRISGNADASRAAEATTSLLAILDDMRRDPESYRGDFVLARQKVLESLLVVDTSSASVVDRLAELARFDLPDAFYDRLAAAVAQVTLADFHAFLVHELPAGNQVFAAFGNRDAVAAAIAASRR